MSGDHQTLIDYSSMFFSGSERLRYRMGLRFMLENQFLQFDHCPAFFQVMSGSGMGLACSGEISDAAF